MNRAFWLALFGHAPVRCQSPHRDRHCRPRLESLEDKVLPAGLLLHPLHLLAPPSGITPQVGPASSSLTPAQVRHAYGFDQITFQNGTVVGNGAGQTIAIVDAYDDPKIASDLAAFDSQFGLAAPPSFTRVGINSAGQ